MYNVTILDDDRAAIKQLASLVEAHPRAAEFSMHCVESAADIDALESRGIQTHILLADIYLPGETSGIRLVRDRFPKESGTQVIYVSGYLHLSLEVYETDHVYFLLKPVDRSKLFSAIDRALAALDEDEHEQRVVAITVNRQLRLVPIDSIRYVESNLRQVIVHTTSETHATYMKLDEIQAKLPESFARCHRSFLVNLANVSALTGDSVTLAGGEVLPVSKNYSSRMKSALMGYIS